MAGCEIKRHHAGLVAKLFDRTNLRWICPQCLAILEESQTECQSQIVRVEVPRPRQVARFVMPVSGLFFILAVVTEILHYWH